MRYIIMYTTGILDRLQYRYIMLLFKFLYTFVSVDRFERYLRWIVLPLP